MKLAIMQPYFLPYIGYFQLMAAVDVFIIYDNIKYTKKGWINRNRMLQNGTDVTFSLPLKQGSDSLLVIGRELSTDFDPNKLLNRFKGAYAPAPYFGQTIALLERIVHHRDRNLFHYIHHSLACLCEHLDIATDVRVSSEIPIDHSLKGQDKVLALCHAVGADVYVNAIGGTELYARPDFLAQHVELRFLSSRLLEYPQFGAPFIPWLSIVDVLMFNPLDEVRNCIATDYDLL